MHKALPPASSAGLSLMPAPSPISAWIPAGQQGSCTSFVAPPASISDFHLSFVGLSRLRSIGQDCTRPCLLRLLLGPRCGQLGLPSPLRFLQGSRALRVPKWLRRLCVRCLGCLHLFSGHRFRHGEHPRLLLKLPQPADIPRATPASTSSSLLSSLRVSSWQEESCNPTHSPQVAPASSRTLSLW